MTKNLWITDMKKQNKFIFFTLLFMISFASVNAVLFTPALPNITSYFALTTTVGQQTITWFLIGYALGQLIYGPIANRFGRKKALYLGISIQIASSFVCVFSGTFHEYMLLVIGRFFLALGSGVGLKMTFTLVNEYYEPKLASQKISYLMLAFSITPGLGAALGGTLNTHYGWQSCFYASAFYGLVLLLLTIRLPETKIVLDTDALKIKNLTHGYSSQFRNLQLVSGGLLMGSGACFIYAFSAIAPFVAINLFSMSSSAYGIANIIPAIGLFLGSIISVQFSKKYSHLAGIKLGILVTVTATMLMMINIALNLTPMLSLFLPMVFIYFGLSFIVPNASTLALSQASDKAHGSAVMNFLNMGLATVVVLTLGFFSITKFLLPLAFIIISMMMIALQQWLIRTKT